MPRRLQCIFCQYTFVVSDDGAALGDCPSCGTELLDNTYIVDLGPVTASGPIEVEHTMEQPLCPTGTDGFSDGTTSEEISRSFLDITASVPALCEADLEEGDAETDFEDVTSCGFDRGRGLDTTSTLEMTPLQRVDETDFDALDEQRPTHGRNGAQIQAAPAATAQVSGFADEEPTNMHSLSDQAALLNDPRALPVSGVGSEEDPIYYADEATVSSNLDLEALAAASTGRSANRPRWRCTTCLAEFPGSRPETCPACGSALRTS